MGAGHARLQRPERDLVLGGTVGDLPLARDAKIPGNAIRFDPVAGLFGPQYLGGNAIGTLVNGDRIFPAMLKAISDAEYSINFETLIYGSGEVGRDFARSLAAKARAGAPAKVSEPA